MRDPALTALLAAGCRPPDPAPVTLDDLAHLFLAQVGLQVHARIVAGGDDLEAWFERAGLDGEPTGGTLTDLTQAEVDAIEELRWRPDPAPCAGVYVISQLSCDLGRAADIALEPDQLALFEGSHEAYERTWDNDPGCYADGTCDAVDWHALIEDDLVMYDISYEMVVRLRRSRDEADTPAALLVRSVMPEPAAEEVDSGGFEQSYHLEAYVPRGDGTLHLYAMWRYGWIWGSDQYLDGLLDFEAQLEDLCVDGWG
jgi:hypothetical protein